MKSCPRSVRACPLCFADDALLGQFSSLSLVSQGAFGREQSVGVGGEAEAEPGSAPTSPVSSAGPGSASAATSGEYGVAAHDAYQKELESQLSKLRQAILGQPVDDSLRQRVGGFLKTLPAGRCVAVRSSSTMEDQSGEQQCVPVDGPSLTLRSDLNPPLLLMPP